MLLKRYLKAAGLNALPPTLEEYSAKVITPTLEAQKRGGAVAIKFEAAYLRSLDFGPAAINPATELAEARALYSRFINGGIPQRAEYLELQNYLMRYIAREAGRLGLPVHFHTGGGCGSYFMAGVVSRKGHVWD
jgi:2-hydroxychromene-2-carboxylate isomerase